MSRRIVFFIAFGAVAWLAVVGIAFAALQRYASTPGGAHTPSPAVQAILREHWRPGVGLVAMAVHPLCPCTDASLSELGDLLARSAGRCQAVLFEYQPLEPTEEWEPTAAVRLLGGVRVPVVPDRGGEIAKTLGAETSGHVVFLDPQGMIQFQGGLTLARGHRGRSPVQDAILASVNGANIAPSRAPTFGCSLTTECQLPAHP